MSQHAADRQGWPLNKSPGNNTNAKTNGLSDVSISDVIDAAYAATEADAFATA